MCASYIYSCTGATYVNTYIYICIHITTPCVLTRCGNVGKQIAIQFTINQQNNSQTNSQRNQKIIHKTKIQKGTQNNS